MYPGGLTRNARTPALADNPNGSSFKCGRRDTELFYGKAQGFMGTYAIFSPFHRIGISPAPIRPRKFQASTERGYCTLIQTLEKFSGQTSKKRIS
jgi:hypothetical protein